MLSFIKKRPIIPFIFLVTFLSVGTANAECGAAACQKNRSYPPLPTPIIIERPAVHHQNLRPNPSPGHPKVHHKNHNKAFYKNCQKNCYQRKKYHFNKGTEGLCKQCIQQSSCKDTCPRIITRCERIPPQILECIIMNPGDIVDFTCTEFSEKLKNGEPYTCQAPYGLDPTMTTKWKIIGKKGDRLIVSSTTEDVGLKDNEGTPIPLTQTCEYDSVGVRGLIQRMHDAEKRVYHFSTCDHFEGIHNCRFTTNGSSILPKKIIIPRME